MASSSQGSKPYPSPFTCITSARRKAASCTACTTIGVEESLTTRARFRSRTRPQRRRALKQATRAGTRASTRENTESRSPATAASGTVSTASQGRHRSRRTHLLRATILACAHGTSKLSARAVRYGRVSIRLQPRTLPVLCSASRQRVQSTPRTVASCLESLRSTLCWKASRKSSRICSMTVLVAPTIRRPQRTRSSSTATRLIWWPHRWRASLRMWTAWRTRST